MTNRILLVIIFLDSITASAQVISNRQTERPDSIATHKVVLDEQGKIISWFAPQSKAYSQFLRQRWNFIKTQVPNSPGPPPRSSYPQYYFYCSYLVKDGVLQAQPDSWMSDIAERIPNWFESASLYYSYTGDSSVMTIVQGLIDYSIEHGTSPPDFAWPNFPYTTTNAGDLEFRGFTAGKRLVLHEVQVDHAGDMGLTYFRLYQFTGDPKYRTAAINVANTLAAKVRTGSATQSAWPYRVVMNTGKVTAEYGANWIGCYELLDKLVHARLGHVEAYRAAMKKARDFLLRFPMKTGFWTDGHTDTDVNSHTYKSNMSASNMKLYLFDHPEFDTAWRSDIPGLIRWTEDNFVARCQPGEPATQWGANLVGEQDSFLPKMDYQTARYGAECARWYAISGDTSYREKAFRSLNWVTYCSDNNGLAFESPVSKDVLSWWSDCYGEGPRMFYRAFAGVPEWAPPAENHILYTEAVLRKVAYHEKKIEYTAVDDNGIEYLRLAFKPTHILVNGSRLSLVNDNLKKEGYTLRELGNGDFTVRIMRKTAGAVVVSGF